MKTLQILTLAILMSATAFGQIYMEDSTANVVGYWDMNEKQTYVVTSKKTQIKDTDTNTRYSSKYYVDIIIVDSTEDSYLIDWFYRDYEIDSENPMVQKLSSIAEDMTIRIKTDELGFFLEVVNWEEVRDFIMKGLDLAKDEMKSIPNGEKALNQIKGIYSTKESIESLAIKDIQQFYAFHGGLYKLGEEYVSDVQAPNAYGGEPFDMNLTVLLEELNPEEDNIIVSMGQIVNSEQLTNAAFEYLIKLAETMEIPIPKKEVFPPMTNENYVTSGIHGSGWILYSVNTVTIKAEGVENIDQRVFRIHFEEE